MRRNATTTTTKSHTFNKSNKQHKWQHQLKIVQCSTVLRYANETFALAFRHSPNRCVKQREERSKKININDFFPIRSYCMESDNLEEKKVQFEWCI